jgi:hypothetical protein
LRANACFSLLLRACDGLKPTWEDYGKTMSDISRMRAIFKSGQFIGHTLRHVKGHDAYNAENKFIGTFAAGHHAVNALLASSTTASTS